MLRWRLTMAPLMIGLFVGICWLDHQAGPPAPYLLVLSLMLGWRSAWELSRLLTVRQIQPNSALTTICCAFTIGANWIGHGALPDVSHGPTVVVTKSAPPSSSSFHLDVLLWPDGFVGNSWLAPPMLAFVCCVLLLLFSSCLRYREPGRNMETLGAELIIVTYIGVLMSMTAQLRWVAGAELGYLVLASVVVATKCGDIGAYALGRLFGKRKLVPRLSPGKTWMGAWGAVLGATAGSVAWFQFGSQMFAKPGQAPCAWYWSALFGAVIGVVGLIGDLAESLIKRDVGAKDAPALIPGFGGLLDVLDSILFAGPVAYVLWLVLPLAPQ